MALTLTQTAKLTKRGFVFFIIALILLAVGITSYRIWYYQYYLPHKPPPVIRPEVTFGVLPSPHFSSSLTTSSNFSYSLATTTGGFPSFPSVVKVYFIPQLGTTFLAADKAKALASDFGFKNGPESISQTQHQFTDDSGGKLTINLDTGNFSFTRVSSSSAELIDSLPDQGKIVEDFKNYLQGKNLLNDDLKLGRSKVIYDQPSIRDSLTAQVSIWPNDFDKLSIVTSTDSASLVRATLNKLKDPNLKYSSLDYVYWTPDSNHSATYPIKTADSAFNDLKNGLGSIIVEPSSPQVNITSVKLAYFESNDYSQYLIPIYVFEGQDFVAYVNAITAQWLSK